MTLRFELSMDSGWIAVADEADLQIGEMCQKVLGERRIALYRLEDGTFAATDNVCTHEYALLTDGWLEGDEVECPLHSGRFNVVTGRGMCFPITKDIKTYSVKLSGGKILLFLESSGDK